MEQTQILKKGGKRLRHGSYRSVYMDNHGKGRRMWRAEYQSIRTDGIVRLRKWFRDQESARKWLHLIAKDN